MKGPELMQLPTVLLGILTEHTDRENRLSMPQILAHLEEKGITAERRSVYKAIRILNDSGFRITFDRSGNMQGYRLQHLFTPAESLYLIDSVRNSFSLTEAEAVRFCTKITSLMSSGEKELLNDARRDVIHTDNSNVMNYIQVLLEAVRDCVYVDFRYYDISVTRQKKYRRRNEKYHLVPYAVISSENRWYCVFWSPVHRGFANYRIDKMDHVNVTEEKADPVPFSLGDHMRAAFRMYHGDAKTVTAEFDLSLTSQVFDQFGSDIIISSVTDRTFTASIRTAVTPPLVSWLLQYPSLIRVRAPQELIGRMKEIADILQKTYQEEK